MQKGRTREEWEEDTGGMGGGMDEPWLYYKGGMEVMEGKNGRRPGEVREKSTRGLGRWQGRNGKKTGEAWEEDKGEWE